MFRTTEGVERTARGAIRALALGLCTAIVGCADTTGLRSVWPDRPSLLGLWNQKPQPTPDPANDYYARYMRAARERSNTTAQRSTDGDDAADLSRTDGASDPPGPDDPLASEEVRRPSTSRTRPKRAAPSDDASPDEPIVVTLGPPEPMPDRSSPPDATLASAGDSSSWEPNPGPSRSSAQWTTAPRLARQDEEQPESDKAPSTPSPRRPATQPSRPATQPTQPSRSSPSSRDARAILARSETKLQSLGTYQVKMSRVERVDGHLQPEEEVILSVHRQPKEVRLQWASGPSQGREVIYSTRIDKQSLFVHMPKTAIPLPTMKMAIDSPMVTRSSRHSIAEAGFDTIVANLRKSVDQVDAANSAQGRAVYRGIEKPPGLDRPSHVFTRKSPNGESWTVFIDARTLLPTMVVAKDASGQLDEKYVYHEVSENPAELASADAFDPDRRWGESGGLLSRFARGGATPSSPANSQSTIR
jgi:Protein of unknown function (DUF1571)